MKNTKHYFYNFEFEGGGSPKKLEPLRSKMHNGSVFISDYKNRRKGYLVSFLDNSKFFLINLNCNSIGGTREVSYHISSFVESFVDSVVPCTDTLVLDSDLRHKDNEYLYGINVDCFETNLFESEKELVTQFKKNFNKYMKENAKSLRTKFIQIERVEFDKDGSILERTLLDHFLN